MHKDLPDSRPPMSSTLRRLALAAAFVASGMAAQGALAATLEGVKCWIKPNMRSSTNSCTKAMPI